MKLTIQMKEALRIGSKGDVYVYLTTCNLAGKCNTVVQTFTDVYKDEYIFLPDHFAQKTKVNLNENRVAVITVAHPTEGQMWAFRGPCNIIQWGHPPNYTFQGVKAGEVLEGWGEWTQRESFEAIDPDLRPPAAGQRGVIVLKVEEIYSTRPEDSGNKVATS
jgi:hypothetical protein